MQTKVALHEGKNVLYDSTNQTLASRNELRKIASSVGSEACVIYIQTSVETIWKRWEENNVNRNRSVVSRGLVQKTIDSFGEPTAEEHTITIMND